MLVATTTVGNSICHLWRDDYAVDMEQQQLG